MINYLLANWKSNKTLAEAEKWFDSFCSILKPDSALEIIIALPSPYIIPIWQKLKTMKAPKISLAAQDISPFPLGSYTGAVAAEMIRGFADYAIIGHSERRRYFHETKQEIANKVTEAISAEITPIVCLDLPYAREQIAAISEEEMRQVIIGYGPVEAAGVNLPQPIAQANEAITHLQLLAPYNPILYGGSITSENAAEYFSLHGVKGLMAATSSLSPEEFATIAHSITCSMG